MTRNVSLYHFIHTIFLSLLLYCEWSLACNCLLILFTSLALVCTVILNRRLNGSYRLQKKIGSGTFSMQTTSSSLIFGLTLIGEVFLACDFPLVEDVVIKLEPLNTRQHFLEHEYHVYQKLSGNKGHSIHSLVWRGRWFQCDGPQLPGSITWRPFMRSHSKLMLSTVLLLADQLVCAFTL